MNRSTFSNFPVEQTEGSRHRLIYIVVLVVSEASCKQNRIPKLLHFALILRMETFTIQADDRIEGLIFTSAIPLGEFIGDGVPLVPPPGSY